MFISTMLNAVNQAANYARENAPTLAAPGQMARNIQQIALPAIALVAMASAQVVSASSAECTACMQACDKIEWAPFTLACYAFCVFGPACR